MLDISKDIHSLSDFKRNTSEFLERMRGSGHPLVLTINGKADLVVQDAAAYQKLLERVDEMEPSKGSSAGSPMSRPGDAAEEIRTRVPEKTWPTKPLSLILQGRRQPNLRLGNRAGAAPGTGVV